MSCASRSSIVLTITATLLASFSAALAGETCPGSRVVSVDYKKEAKSSKETKANIVDTAVKAGSFKTLAAALEAAGLVDTLKGKGPFTVLAPTDKAFDKLPAGTVKTLLKPENKEKLVAILTYHVVPGKVEAADVVKLKSAKTLQGQTVAIDTKEGVKFNNAEVVKADIDCTNGVIHVIDTVLMPNE